jgi:tetratricopeptide (TPR) repeat protein
MAWRRSKGFLIAGVLATLAPGPVHAAEPGRSETEGTSAASGVDAAIAARKAGRFEDAAQLLNAWLQTHPQDAKALHELGVLYALHGQLREAVAKFEAALAIDPDATETRRNLAETLRADQRCAVALPHYRTLAGADLQDQVALRGLVLCHHALGQVDAALQACGEIQRRFAGMPFAAWARQREVQIRALVDAGAVTPQQADAEGAALFAEKRYADAAVWLAKALELQANPDRAYRLAMAQLGSGDPLAALGSLQRALQLDAHHVASLSAWPTVAKALRLQGQGGVDVAFSRQARMPSQMIAHALAEGDLVLARQLLQATLQPPVNGKSANQGAVLAVLNGEVLLREGKLAQAGQAFQEALAQRPKYPPALKGLAVVAAQQGRTQEARELAGLPPHAGMAEVADADLQRFVALRRAELMHQLQMAEDPGLKPLPPLQDQLADATPPPAPPPVVVEPSPAPVKVKPTRHGRHK